MVNGACYDADAGARVLAEGDARAPVSPDWTPHMARLSRLLSLVMTAGLVAGASQPAAPAQQPTFRTGVDLVAVDVLVVRDRDGQPITNLTASDFALTVDGKPRPVSSAVLLTYATTRDVVLASAGIPAADGSVAAPGRILPGQRARKGTRCPPS